MPGKFNRLPFGRPSAAVEDIELTGDARCVIGAGVTLGADLYPRYAASGQIGATLIAIAQISDTLDGAVRWETRAALAADYHPDPTKAVTTIRCLAAVGEDCYVVEAPGMALGANLKAGSDLYHRMETRSAFGAGATACADYDPGRTDFYEIVGCLVSTATFDITTLTVDATIPPGGRLSIDSNIYTVLLNGDNILHLHSGTWLHMARDVSEILIDSGGSGALESVILYTERYL